MKKTFLIHFINLIIYLNNLNKLKIGQNNEYDNNDLLKNYIHINIML